MDKPKFTRVIHSRDHKDGVYTLTDVRGDANWFPVVAVESHHGHNGVLYSVINHRDYERAIAPYEESK